LGKKTAPPPAGLLRETIFSSSSSLPLSFSFSLPLFQQYETTADLKLKILKPLSHPPNMTVDQTVSRSSN